MKLGPCSLLCLTRERCRFLSFSSCSGNDPSLGCNGLNNFCYTLFDNTRDLKFSLKVASFRLSHLPCPMVQDVWFIPWRNLQLFGDVSFVKWHIVCFKILLLTCFLCWAWISVINHALKFHPNQFFFVLSLKYCFPFTKSFLQLNTTSESVILQPHSWAPAASPLLSILLQPHSWASCCNPTPGHHDESSLPSNKESVSGTHRHICPSDTATSSPLLKARHSPNFWRHRSIWLFYSLCRQNMQCIVLYLKPFIQFSTA